MSFLSTLTAAFKGGVTTHVPLARSFTSPWLFADLGSARSPFDYNQAVKRAYLDNPVAQRAVRLVAEGIGGAALVEGDPELTALVKATSAGQSLLETLASQLLLHGNAYVQVIKDGAGRPAELFALRPERIAGQTQKETFVNEMAARIDALLHGAIEGEQAAPPTAPADGLAWLVAAGASGDWTGQSGKIAARQAGNWLFSVPHDGIKLLNRATGQEIRYSGGWKAAARPAAPSGGTVIDSQARSAIAAILTALTSAGIVPAV